MTFGVARELRPDLALSVDYIYLRGHDLFRTVDLNGPSAFDTTTGATRTVAAGRRDASVRIAVARARALRDPGRRLQADPRRRLRRQRLVSRPEAEPDEALLATTISISCRTPSRGPRTSRTISARRRRAATRSTSAARSPSNDVPHIFVANGTYILPYDDFALRHRGVKSGPTVDPLAGTDLNGDGFTTDRPGTFARNSFRLPTSKTVDVSLAKTFTFGGPHQLESAHGRVQPVRRVQRHPREQHLRARGRQSRRRRSCSRRASSNPRQFQFAARYRF